MPVLDPETASQRALAAKILECDMTVIGEIMREEQREIEEKLAKRRRARSNKRLRHA